MRYCQAEVVHPRGTEQGVFLHVRRVVVDKETMLFHIDECFQDAQLCQSRFHSGEYSGKHVSKHHISKWVARATADESVNSIFLALHAEVCVRVQGL